MSIVFFPSFHGQELAGGVVVMPKRAPAPFLISVLGADLLAAGGDLDGVAVVAVHHDEVAVGRQRHAQGSVQRTARREASTPWRRRPSCG